MVDRVLYGIGHRAAERAGRHVDVGIGEQQPGPARLFRAQVQCMNLAQPVLGQLLDVDRQYPRIGHRHAVDDVGGAIRGAVVDEDDLQIGIVLRQDRTECRFERARLHCRQE